MRALDLFAGAGGAARGLQLAGFHVTGIDIRPQPRYAGDLFIQADVLRPPVRLEDFDLIWASPPCQAYTQMSARWRGRGGKADGHPRLIGPVRGMLEASGRPWVIENVVGARRELRSPITLSGAHFGLGVHRPRLFETSFFMLAPVRQRAPHGFIGVYGKRPDGRRLWTRLDGSGGKRSELRCARSLEQGSAAMGIDWMEWAELKEAVPPAYSEYIARAWLAQQKAAA